MRCGLGTGSDLPTASLNNDMVYLIYLMRCRYYMAIGTSGNQFKNAGVAGAMMADLIVRVEDGAVQNGEELVRQLLAALLKLVKDQD